MITLYGFGRIFPEGIGETKDMRVEWALLELALPYRVHALDHTAGELDTEAYLKLSAFRQVPVIDDDGFVVSESGAILLYLAEKYRKLIPDDLQGRTHVMQWCFAATTTVMPPLAELDMIDAFDKNGELAEHRALWDGVAQRFLGSLEQQLEARSWIAGADFTVADILLANVLRMLRRTKTLAAYPRLTDYYARAHARPAWRTALARYAERLGVDPATIS
ncbi:MAG TPA: glutathione S-transferase family protein [Nannocystaceae bacterium]|nr:glutathione S-transferase family protein [Nannocystaceae bacterium]